MAMKPILEVCVDNIKSALAAAEGGAGRIELCASLREGGLTPPHGLIKRVIAKLAPFSCKVHVMIRPRAGDFLYSSDELLIMEDDIRNCKHLGAHGVVFGFLTRNGTIDRDKVCYFVKLCKELELDMTFHRAFDLCFDLTDALHNLIECQVPRLLTSGGHASAELGALALKGLVEAAQGQIIVMAGAGITPDNIKKIIEKTRVDEVHGSMKCDELSNMLYRPRHLSLSSESIKDYVWWTTDETKVQEAMKAIHEQQ